MQVTAAIGPTVEVAGNIADDTNSFYAVVKGIVFPIFDLLGLAWGDTPTPVLDACRGSMSEGMGFIGAVRIFGDFDKWVNNERGSWQSTVALVGGTVNKLLSTAKWLEKTSLISLGVVSSTVIGNIPVLTLTSSILRIGAESFSIWDNYNESNNIDTEKLKDREGLTYWKGLRDGVEADRIHKVNNAFVFRVNLDAVQVDRVINYQVEKYETALRNHPNQKKLKWLSIAFSVTRIAFTALTLVGMALSIYSLPAMIIASAILGLGTGTIGLSRTIMTKMKRFKVVEEGPAPLVIGNLTIK